MRREYRSGVHFCVEFIKTRSKRRDYRSRLSGASSTLDLLLRERETDRFVRC